jgi:hypothetical protein
MLQPFANIGGRNAIPNTPDATPGHASYDLGFPPLTRTPIEQGGIPPSGLDMNGVGFEITAHTAWVNAGGQYTFDVALAAFTGGYALGAVIQSDDGLSSYRSMVANNTDNFNTTPSVIGVTWEPYAGRAVNGAITTVTVAASPVTLTASQSSAAIINVTGTLTANVILTLAPQTAPRSWRITNSTTGAFGLTVRIMGAGAPLILTQGKSNTLFYNGSSLQYGDWDSGLDSPPFRGVPTAPTAAPLSNNLQLANTAYVEAAVATVAVNSSPQLVKTSITAGAYGDYWVDTRGGPITITLPDPPAGANPVTFHDVGGAWDSKPLTINSQTKPIQYPTGQVVGNLICNERGETFRLWYDTTNTTWRIE